MQISREIFDAQRRPRFGTANPERMRMEFWEWMIRGDDQPPLDDGRALGELGWNIRAGKLKSGYGPYRARDLFQAPANREDGPIWTFERMGRTCTELLGGRLLYIGGENEDFYDPDFCIYSDVIVIDPDGQIEIYGYPKDVFPPTDFHTASLIGNQIIIIGRLGYSDDRRPGHTSVYSLDVTNFRIAQIPTVGEGPGWVFEHEADVSRDGVITIRGGRVVEERDGEQTIWRNFEDFALDSRSGVWRKLTNRNWAQFSIRQEDRRLFVRDREPNRDAQYPSGIEYSPEACDEEGPIRILVEGIPVSIALSVSEVEIVIEGQLPEELAKRVAESIRANLEAAIQLPCVLEQA
jgi:hypothetical protein